MRVIRFPRTTEKSTMPSTDALLDQYTEVLKQLFRLVQLDKQVPSFQALLLGQLDSLWVQLMEPETYTLLPEAPCA